MDVESINNSEMWNLPIVEGNRVHSHSRHCLLMNESLKCIYPYVELKKRWSSGRHRIHKQFATAQSVSNVSVEEESPLKCT